MFVYLKADYNICYERVQKRQREGETSISKEYLKKNNDYHDKWLLNHDNVMILDGNQDCTQNPILLESHCMKIIHHIQDKYL